MSDNPDKLPNFEKALSDLEALVSRSGYNILNEEPDADVGTLAEAQQFISQASTNARDELQAWHFRQAREHLRQAIRGLSARAVGQLGRREESSSIPAGGDVGGCLENPMGGVRSD